MKKIAVLVVLLVFAVGSVCFAAECATKSEAKDPITATAEVAGKTVQAAGEVVVAPVKAIAGEKEAK